MRALSVKPRELEHRGLVDTDPFNWPTLWGKWAQDLLPVGIRIKWIALIFLSFKKKINLRRLQAIMFRPNLSHMEGIAGCSSNIHPSTREKKWLAMCSGENTHILRLSYTWEWPSSGQ